MSAPSQTRPPRPPGDGTRPASAGTKPRSKPRSKSAAKSAAKSSVKSGAGVPSLRVLLADLRLLALRASTVVPVDSAARRTASVAGSVAGSAAVRGLVIALLAALGGYVVGLIPTLVVWMSAPDSGLTAGSTLRVGALVWLTGQGAPVAIGDTVYTLTPWGLAVIPVLLLLSMARGASRRLAQPASRAVLVIVTTVTYAVILAGAAALTALPAASASPVGVALMAAITAAVATSIMALAPLGWARLPRPVRVAVRAGGVAVMWLLGVGALVVGLSLALHMDTAVAMQQSLAIGVLGTIGVMAVGLAFLPVIVVWGAAYVLGAGVVLGPSVVASPFLATVAPTTLPPLPLLAAVPSSASPLAWALPLVAVVGGVLAGLVIARRTPQSAWWMPMALAAGSAALVAVVMAVLSVLASGALGSTRLAHVGPSPLLTGGLAFLLIVLGAVPSALAGGRGRDRRPQLAVVTSPAVASPAVASPAVSSPAVASPAAPAANADDAVVTAPADDDVVPLSFAQAHAADDDTVGVAVVVTDLDATAELPVIPAPVDPTPVDPAPVDRA